MGIRSRLVAREFNNSGRPDVCVGTPPLGALKAICSIVANNEDFGIMRVGVSRAYFHAPVQMP
eukprot:11215435-Lingulodinium_polyedra.AAC.1